MKSRFKCTIKWNQSKVATENRNQYFDYLIDSLFDQKRQKRKKLSPGSLSFLTLEKMVKSQDFLGDLTHLTNFNHTGTLKVYHSIYNKYRTKQLNFSYPIIISRAELAALEFNAWSWITRR